MKLTHGDRKRERSVDEPLPTVTGANRGELGLVEPFIFANRTNNAPKSTDEPIPSLCTADHIALVEPMILPQGGGGVARPISEPTSTVHGDGMGLFEPCLVIAAHGEGDGRRVKSLDDPLGAVTGSNRFGVVEPQLMKYYGTGQAHPVSKPVPTVTAKDRLALVQPVINGLALDIKFRMLQPHELASAMSFPKGYKFTGNKGEQVKQIGNAWDVSMGRALFAAILDARRSVKTPATVERIA